MKKRGIFLCMLLFVFVTATPAMAYTDLFEYAFNVDGDLYGTYFDPLPGDADETAFDDLSGLGTISWTVSGTGSHSFISYFDIEIDQWDNTWWNEFGATNGSPAAGQSWEIDEPGFVYGDIYDNFKAGTLDNSNGVPASAPDDVSFALGWDFSLAAGETATIAMVLSDVEPGIFYLAQSDTDSPDTVFFSSALTIRGEPGPGGEPVPEPATILLLGSGLVGIGAACRKRKMGGKA